MIVLIRDGKPLARIVMAEGCPAVAKEAATELQRYLQQMSGAKLPITNVPSPDEPNIYVGSGARASGPDLSGTDLGPDGYVVRTIGDDLVLAGAQPYSSLYAVYHLLERHLDCGFFEDGDQVPQRQTIEVPAIDECCKPHFDWRIYFTCMEDGYSGMRWWSWEQFKPWVDWLVKKRFNRWDAERVVDCCGILPLAAARLGVEIELTGWQEQRLKVLRRVLDYARERGIRTFYPITSFLLPSANAGDPGVYAYAEGLQIQQFVQRYAEVHGEPVGVLGYDDKGHVLSTLDPRHPVTHRMVTAAVEAYREALGTDHLYTLALPTEGGWANDDDEEMDRVTYAMVVDLLDPIRAADPEADIFVQNPVHWHKTFKAGQKAVLDSGVSVLGDHWLNQPARYHDFLCNDYYWGRPWTTGMVVCCGKHNNPNGGFLTAIEQAKALAVDPRAANCRGFRAGSEVSHRIMIMHDLFCELAWDPARVDPEEYLRDFSRRRYGPEWGTKLHEATALVTETLLSHMAKGATNGPLYRRLRGGYVPGTTARSVKTTFSYLPKLRQALEILLSGHAALDYDWRYRFDVVDCGRTYLGAIFNHRLAGARKAMRAMDRDAFETHAAGVEAVMHFTARLCSAHPQFRLQNQDDWAAQWPEMLPGCENSLVNWRTFTNLCGSLDHDHSATDEMCDHLHHLDYAADDFAELVEHYYWPRIKLYLQRMRERIESGRDISGRLVYQFTDDDIPCQASATAPPYGKLPWSPYGPTLEPELTAGQKELTLRLIEAGTVSGRFDFCDGPIGVLLRELLERFPVPEDLPAILAEPDPEPEIESRAESLSGSKPGDVVQGFRAPGVVEQVRAPEELGLLAEVEKVSAEYNFMRGDVTRYRFSLPNLLSLTRLADEPAPTGQAIARFEFDVAGRRYLLCYDPGSDQSIARVDITALSNPA